MQFHSTSMCLQCGALRVFMANRNEGEKQQELVYEGVVVEVGNQSNSLLDCHRIFASRLYADAPTGSLIEAAGGLSSWCISLGNE